MAKVVGSSLLHLGENAMQRELVCPHQWRQHDRVR